jgi:S1-C subfamily serine protease
MKKVWLFSCFLLSVFLTIAISHQTMANNLTSDQVSEVARKTTVVVAQDLKQGDNIALREAFRPGSGVIVGRRGSTYYVATNFHVVSARGTDYGVRTFDGVVHFVDDEKTKNNIDAFGKYLQNRIEGSDLAIVQFQATPQQQYPVAKINLNKKPKDSVYVAGWPDPGPKFPERTFRMTGGILNNILKNDFEDGDYNTQYNAPTRRGMSGGPVFNQRGELIAIHGRGGGKNLAEYGEPDKDCLDTRNCFNRGISTEILIDRAKANSKYASLFVPPEYIPSEPVKLAQQPSPPTASRIANIFDEFSSLKARLRDVPSGGKGNLLIDD